MPKTVKDVSGINCKECAATHIHALRLVFEPAFLYFGGVLYRKSAVGIGLTKKKDRRCEGGGGGVGGRRRDIRGGCRSARLGGAFSA